MKLKDLIATIAMNATIDILSDHNDGTRLDINEKSLEAFYNLEYSHKMLNTEIAQIMPARWNSGAHIVVVLE